MNAIADASHQPRAPADLEHFAARCAHDLNNLLTGILGNLELMESRARRNGVTLFDGYLEGARHAAIRATEFTQRLLIFSGRAARAPAPVPVNALIRDLVELMREQSFPIVTDLADDAGDAFCDHIQLEVALLELLNNGRDAGGQVTVRSRAVAGQVEIAVIDTGSGMAPEVQARCSEPFFSTRPGGAGKGLGLTMVENIVRQAQGSMAIHSDAGTTVTLRLPRPPG